MKYEGTTLNERLLKAGLLDGFNRVSRKGDREGMIAILKRVELDERQISYTVDIITRRQRKFLVFMYGFLIVTAILILLGFVVEGI